MSEDPIPRDTAGRQLLEHRQKHKDMTLEDKALHARCLLVMEDRPSRRAICWSDDTARLAARISRGFTIAEDPYTDPVDSGRKKDVIIIRVPMKNLQQGTDDGVGIKGA